MKPGLQLIDTSKFLPESTEAFQVYAANLATLLRLPSDIATTLLAKVYGFASPEALLHEVSRAHVPGPFIEPTARPAFFSWDVREDGAQQTGFQPLASKENAFYWGLSNALNLENADGHFGENMRRLYSVIDAGFLCSLERHRELFISTLEAIHAMEGSRYEAQEHLRFNWPPGFWAYIQIHHTPYEALTPESMPRPDILLESDRLPMGDVKSPTEMLAQLAVHRAPAIYLAMVKPYWDLPLPVHEVEDSWFYCEHFAPSITLECEGLFAELQDRDEFTLSGFIAFGGGREVAIPQELVAQAFRSGNVRQRLREEPFGFDEETVEALLNRRVSELLAMCVVYEEHAPKKLLLSSYRRCFHSQYRDLLAPLPFEQHFHYLNKWEAERPFLHCHLMLEQVDPQGSEAITSIWAFKALFSLSHQGPALPKLMGSMAGWTITPHFDNFVGDPDDFQYELGSAEDTLSIFARKILRNYLPYVGYDSLLSYVNGNPNCGMTATAIELEPEFRGKGLAEQMLELFCDALGANLDWNETPPYWKVECQVNQESFPEEQMFGDEGLPKLYPEPPGVICVDIPYSHRELSRHFRAMRIGSDELDWSTDVFTAELGFSKPPPDRD